MPVVKGNYIKVEYTGTLDNGEVFDSTEKHGEPLGFTVGIGQMIPGFDKAVMGMELNGEKEIHLESDEAYGDRNEEAMQQFPLDQLPKDMKVEPGMVLQMATQHGEHVHHIPALVAEVGETEITLDLNHPMAGMALNFKLKVIEILDCDPNQKEGCGSGCGCGN